jgi:LPXTG-motif cell wall-anchored protein
MDAQGNPQFVPDQHNIIDVIPGMPGYSPFWDVNLVKVPASYKANTITSAAGVTQSGYEILHPGIVVNCPVVRTDQVISGGGPVVGMPRTGVADANLTIWLVIGAGLALLAGLVLRRRVREYRNPSA